MNKASQSLDSADFALSALRLSWCSDCHADTLFERPPAEIEGSDGEWACTTCGAAYFDGVDAFAEPMTAHHRGVA